MSTVSTSTSSSSTTTYTYAGCCQSGNYGAFYTTDGYIFSVTANDDGSGGIQWKTSTVNNNNQTPTIKAIGMSDSINNQVPSMLVFTTNYSDGYGGDIFISNDFGTSFTQITEKPTNYQGQNPYFTSFIIIQETLYVIYGNFIYQYYQNAWVNITPVVTDTEISWDVLGATAPQPIGLNSSYPPFIYASYSSSNVDGLGYFVSQITPNVNEDPIDLSYPWSQVSLSLIISVPTGSQVNKIVGNGNNACVFAVINNGTLWQLFDGISAIFPYQVTLSSLFTDVVCTYNDESVVAIGYDVGSQATLIYYSEDGSEPNAGSTFQQLPQFAAVNKYSSISLGMSGSTINLLVTVNVGLAYSLEFLQTNISSAKPIVIPLYVENVQQINIV